MEITPQKIDEPVVLEPEFEVLPPESLAEMDPGFLEMVREFVTQNEAVLAISFGLTGELLVAAVASTLYAKKRFGPAATSRFAGVMCFTALAGVGALRENHRDALNLIMQVPFVVAAAKGMVEHVLKNPALAQRLWNVRMAVLATGATIGTNVFLGNMGSPEEILRILGYAGIPIGFTLNYETHPIQQRSIIIACSSMAVVGSGMTVSKLLEEHGAVDYMNLSFFLLALLMVVVESIWLRKDIRERVGVVIDDEDTHSEEN